ncbi:oxidoreductase [Nostoc sp. UHCC 0302]|uniref:oxidoreductase n=1 Tax=Nostoc sp. UHCC 0302 TaxID=3134896 RepID=UPI00311CC25F
MSTQTSRVWLITGSSTGLGRALTEAVLKRGEIVVATARQPQQLAELETQYPRQIITLRLDVTKPDEVQKAVNQAIATFGHIDILVNNAGYGMMGAIEEISDTDVRQQFETNFFGVLNVIRAVLPYLRHQRSGHILNLSSVCGFVSNAAGGIYCSTKFALEGLSEALAKEVASLGIKVTIVEPGAFRTDFTGRSLSLSNQCISDYGNSSAEIIKLLKQIDGKQLGNPIKAAEAMIQVINSDSPPLRLVLGSDAVAMIENKLTAMRTELEAWKPVAMHTAFDEAKVAF